MINDDVAPVYPFPRAAAPGSGAVSVRCRRRMQAPAAGASSGAAEVGAALRELGLQQRAGRCRTCGAPTSLVGATCAHCRERFCLAHAQAEVHGCGAAAAAAARCARRRAAQRLQHAAAQLARGSRAPAAAQRGVEEGGARAGAQAAERHAAKGAQRQACFRRTQLRCADVARPRRPQVNKDSLRQKLDAAAAARRGGGGRGGGGGGGGGGGSAGASGGAAAGRART
jgi:hypothetical protein